MTAQWAQAAPVQVFDRYARLVRDALDSSIGLVSAITEDSQFMPGSVGLTEPWQTTRTVPLHRSVCQYVVVTNALVTIADADDEAGVVHGVDPAHSFQPISAMRALGVRAYAGFPLRSEDGTAVGAVCAVDWRPRHRRTEDAAMLADIAGFCSTEIALQETRGDLTRALAREAALTSALGSSESVR